VTGAAAPAIQLAASARGGRVAAALPAALLLVFVLVALAAPLLAPADPARQSLLARLRPPGFATGACSAATDELFGCMRPAWSTGWCRPARRWPPRAN